MLARLTILIGELVRELLGEHLHVVHLLVLVEVPPHGRGQLRVEHGQDDVFTIVTQCHCGVWSDC